jgi:HK97 family phage portal protein
VQSTLGQAVWRTENKYSQYAKEGYEKNPDVYACIRLIATAVAGIEWNVFSERNGELELVERHPLNDLLDRPNPFQSRYTFFETYVSYLLLDGNGYIEKTGPDSGPNARVPKELYVLRPDRVKVEYDASGYPLRYVYTHDNGTVEMDAADVLHKRLFHPESDHYGMSPLKAAAYSVDIANEARSWNMALLQNSGRPSGAVQTEAQLTEDQYETLRSRLNEKHAGAGNAGRIAILEGGLTWEPMGLSPQDMAWEQTIKMTTREICAAFNVPPELIGDHEHATYSNYQEARKAFYEETVLPLLDSIRDDLNRWLPPCFGDVIIDYDRDDIEALKEDRDAVWKRAIEGVRNGLITINDARGMLNLEAVPEPEADQLLIPFNMMPLSQSTGKEPAKAKDPAEERKSRDQSWLLQTDRRKQAWWPVWAKAAANEFSAEKKAVASVLRELDTPDSAATVLDQALEAQQSSWLDMYMRMYRGIADEFAGPVLDMLKSKGRFEHKSLDWTEEYLSFIERTALSRIRDISATTKALVLKEIDAGMAAGENMYQIAERVASKYDDFSEYRAMTAARTEVNAAANYGSQLAAESTGLPIVKRWLSYVDDRTRGGENGCDHISADGQERELHQPYDVSGEQLMFPGDTSLGASAGNIVNCRCTETYEVMG